MTTILICAGQFILNLVLFSFMRDQEKVNKQLRDELARKADKVDEQPIYYWNPMTDKLTRV